MSSLKKTVLRYRTKDSVSRKSGSGCHRVFTVKDDLREKMSFERLEESLFDHSNLKQKMETLSRLTILRIKKKLDSL